MYLIVTAELAIDYNCSDMASDNCLFSRACKMLNVCAVLQTSRLMENLGIKFRHLDHNLYKTMNDRGMNDK